MRTEAITLALIVATTAVTSSVNAMIPGEHREMTAFDCMAPRHMTRVSSDHTQPCQNITKPVLQKDVAFVILQQATFRRLQAIRCEIKKTTLAMYCGNADHQTLIPPLSTFAATETVRAETCRQMYKKKAFFGPDGRRHSITIGHTTSITLDVVGYFDWRQDTDMKCRGGRAVFPDGMIKEDTNIVDFLQVTVSKEEIKIGPDGRVHLGPRDDVSTPCSEAAGSCETDLVTHVWEPPSKKEACMHFQLRRSEGILITGKDLSETFLSRDGSMIRLLKQDPTELCGHRAYKTEYDLIHMLPVEYADAFPMDLPHEEMSVITYVNQQDSYLYGHLSDYILKEFQAVQQRECQRQNNQHGGGYAAQAAAQRAAVDGETLYLGDGEFATSSGEIWHHYTCTEIVVLARDEKHCYDGLPVDLMAPDLARLRKVFPANSVDPSRTGEYDPEEPEFFLEPHTRRIKRFSARLTCSEIYPASYVNRHGAWVDVTPTLRLGRAPYSVTGNWVQRVISAPAPLDFEKGGIYPAEMIRKAELYSQVPRRAIDIVNTLIDQIDVVQLPTGHLTPSGVFPEIPEMSLEFAKHFWLFIDRGSRAITITLLIFTIFRIITFVGGLVTRCITLHRVFGLSFRLLSALMPSLMDYILTSFGWREEKQDERTLRRRKQEGDFEMTHDFRAIYPKIDEPAAIENASAPSDPKTLPATTA